MKRKYSVIPTAFLACAAAFWNVAECAAAPIKLTVLTAGIGQKDAKFPEDIVKFCNPVIIEGNSSIPDIELIRIDLAEEKRFEINIPSSWTDRLFKPDPRLLARKKCESLPNLKITENFSNSIQSDLQQIDQHKNRECNGLITFEVTDKSPVGDILSKLQKQIE